MDASTLVLILSLALDKTSALPAKAAPVLQCRVGEKIKAIVTWKNISNTVVSVPSDGGRSQIEYILTDIYSKKPILISERQLEMKQSPGEPNFAQQQSGFNLAPGKTASREEDLSKLMAGNQIKAGSYEIIAHYTTGNQDVASNTVKLKILR